MSAPAQLQLRNESAKRMVLQPGQPLTIGKATSNRLALPNHAGVAEHHAVVRFSQNHGWVVCDWQSGEGTFLEGERIRRCRPLSDGDEIRLGRQGPVLVFSQVASAQAQAAQPASASRPSAPVPTGSDSIAIGEMAVRFDQIRSVVVQSEPHHPHIFSWWLLVSLAGLLLLPFPMLFWPLELAALGGWILLGSRKSHTLVVVLHDGRAQRRPFANRTTALAHRNGIRRAIGQSPDQS